MPVGAGDITQCNETELNVT